LAGRPVRFLLRHNRGTVRIGRCRRSGAGGAAKARVGKAWVAKAWVAKAFTDFLTTPASVALSQSEA